jgi:hypothetical protein
MTKPGNRLPSETVSVQLGATDECAGHELAISLAYERILDGKLHVLREVVFVSRGKIGNGLDAMLHELGIKLSRAIQSRDPETGEALKP